MRISDWSSDVCSSDLQAIDHRGFIDPGTASRHWSLVQSPTDRFRFLLLHPLGMFLRLPQQPKHIAAPDLLYVGVRSEEHTSELQSLMRISYAVFCLKKQN